MKISLIVSIYHIYPAVVQVQRNTLLPEVMHKVLIAEFPFQLAKYFKLLQEAIMVQ